MHHFATVRHSLVNISSTAAYCYMGAFKMGTIFERYMGAFRMGTIFKSKATINSLPDELARYVVPYLPLKTVHDSVLMMQLFPKSVPRSLKQLRFNPNCIFSKLTNDVPKMLNMMLLTDTALAGFHASQYFDPGASPSSHSSVHASEWTFYCSGNRIQYMIFQRYIESIGAVIEYSGLLTTSVAVPQAIDPEVLRGKIYSSGMASEISLLLLDRSYIHRILNSKGSSSRCLITGYGCVTLEQCYSKLQLEGNEDSSQHYFSFFRSCSDKRAFMLSYHNTGYHNTEYNTESLSMFRNMRATSWTECMDYSETGAHIYSFDVCTLIEKMDVASMYGSRLRSDYMRYCICLKGRENQSLFVLRGYIYTTEQSILTRRHLMSRDEMCDIIHRVTSGDMEPGRLKFELFSAPRAWAFMYILDPVLDIDLLELAVSMDIHHGSNGSMDGDIMFSMSISEMMRIGF